MSNPVQAITTAEQAIARLVYAFNIDDPAEELAKQADICANSLADVLSENELITLASKLTGKLTDEGLKLNARKIRRNAFLVWAKACHERDKEMWQLILDTFKPKAKPKPPEAVQ